MRNRFSALPPGGVSLSAKAELSIPPKASASNAPRTLSSPSPQRWSKVPPVALKPTALDTIIQSSIVEILRSYDISVAPRARAEVVGHVPDSDVVGIIAFEGSNIMGNLTLSVPSTVWGPAMPRRARDTTHAEWTYELTNQVMGVIKNRLLQFQVKLRTHLPAVLSGVALEWLKRRTVVEVLYCFAALRGEVSVMVDASLARASLEYSNASVLVTPNDPLLFG